MGLGLTNNFESNNWNKSEQILSYIALKGCAWATDIKRNCLIPIEDVNRILNELIHKKDLQIVEPFERFAPPDIIMTRIKDLRIENGNSLNPENWSKRAFFYLTEDGFNKWVERNRGQGKRAHNIYQELFSLILKPKIEEKQGLNSTDGSSEM